MHWLSWIVVVLALAEGGWLAFDGGHALATGDYVTPSSGTHAGELGPWSKVVVAVGMAPRSTFMKFAHLIIGSIWIVMVVCFVLRLSWAWTGMLVCAVAGMWYLPFGTLLSVIQIVLLLTPSVRSSMAA